MKWIVLINCFLFSLKTYAHPVAYEGAFSFMSMNTSKMSENMLIYSPRFWLGTGLMHVQTKNDKEWSNLHLGWLVKRWNQSQSQGNLYIYGGPGILKEKNKDSQDSRYFTRLAIQADWETREIYTLFKYNTNRTNNEFYDEYQARLGFAPYLANYNEINSWLFVQVDHRPQSLMQEKWSVTPVLRQFYKNVLWEIGSSLESDWMINVMVRY